MVDWPEYRDPRKQALAAMYYIIATASEAEQIALDLRKIERRLRAALHELGIKEGAADESEDNQG